MYRLQNSIPLWCDSLTITVSEKSSVAGAQSKVTSGVQTAWLV